MTDQTTAERLRAAEQFRDTARFLRRCRGTEPASHFEAHAIECERAAALLAEAERPAVDTQPICMMCDGCGWCEGSPAFTCPKCKGSGTEPVEKWMLERKWKREEADYETHPPDAVTRAKLLAEIERLPPHVFPETGDRQFIALDALRAHLKGTPQ